MPYIYETSFTIRPDQMDELQIGHSLGRVLAFLKAQLPSRALYSIDDPATTRLLLLSEWGSWEALKKHRDSEMAETKVLSEFDPHVIPQDMTTRVYSEVGPKAY
jgi:quinol monooxygenase YgiN